MSQGPFDDPDRTRFRPTPGAAIRRAPAGAAAEAAAIPSDLGAAVPLVGPNPVVAACMPPLAVCARLRAIVDSPRAPAELGDADRLRQQFQALLAPLPQRLRALGLDERQQQAAHYAVCALADDLVLRSPVAEAWKQQTLVARHHGQAVGGDGFFDLLDRTRARPERDAGLLALLHACLSLGFEGRYRLLPRGAQELRALREDVYALLSGRQGTASRVLSPAWAPSLAGSANLRPPAPLWAAPAVAAGVLTAAFAFLAFSLGAENDRAVAAFAAAPPQGTATLARMAPPLPQPRGGALERLRGFLAPEVGAGLVEVVQANGGVTVRLLGRGLFATGKVEVDPSRLPLLARIAQALETEPGRVTVLGHTDNQPIRSLRYPSNWDLSRARAEAVMRLLADRGVPAARLHTEGRGEGEPLAGNDTEEGRQRNRRVEVVLVPAPAQPRAQAAGVP